MKDKTNQRADHRVLLEAEQPVNRETRLRIEDYLARTGLNRADFARRIGYSEIAIRLFMTDRYERISGSARNLVKAANEFMDQHPIGENARLVGELYDTENVRTIRETFEQLLPKPVAYMIYAPPGSQKSFVLEHEVQRLNRDELAKEDGRRAFYVYARQGLRPRDMMRRVATSLGCRVSGDIEPMLSSIKFDFRHHRVLLVVDEAQHLSIECFETLRELLDQPPFFSLLFAGSHDLKRKFDEFSATLEQWNSRIVAKVRLPGLEKKEARGIIDREIGHLLEGKTAAEAATLANGLIASSTVRDAFEGNRTYINVRTLTNALDRIRAAAAKQQSGVQTDLEVVA